MARKNIKKLPKPEYTIKVVPKKTKTTQPKKTQVSPKKQNVQHKKRITTDTKRRLFVFTFAALAVIVSAVVMAVSIKNANQAYENAELAGASISEAERNNQRYAKLIGTNEQLTKEIDNYAAAPADLQQYVLKDYRTLKQKCIVNGKIYGSLSYAIASTADATYAQIKRNCNGEQTQILKKFGETWTVVHEGNDPPLCSLVNDLMIPQRVSLNCVIGGTTYLNPNP